MSVLFSPIGTADPLTQLGDGPMLHIVRHYRPERVVLFLSPKMAQLQEQDQRYTKAIELLSVECHGGDVPMIELVKSNATDVYDFDVYISEFEQKLIEISKENGGDTILVNVSSGTPAMKGSLVALGAFGRFTFTPLQVLTPRKGPNKREDREDQHKYDLDFLWDYNLDNEEGRSCRILEVKTPNFSDRLLLGNIRSLITRYNYVAAVSLARQAKTISPEARMMIEAAVDRLNLNGQKSAQVFAQSDMAYSASTTGLVAEYVSMLEVMLEQGRWADFMRALTPVLTETMLRYLRPVLPDRRYLKPSSKPGDYSYDKRSIAQDVSLSKLINVEKAKYLNNYTLDKLVDAFCRDGVIINRLHRLYVFERDGSRNEFAHLIVRVNKKDIERNGGMTMEEVMQSLLELNEVRPGLYKRINEAICKLL